MDVARTRFVRKQAPIPPYALDVRGLKMSYGNTEVLRGVDLKVAPGEVVALLGPNGAGKTTTIEILEGLRCRTGGKVLVLGTDPECGDERWQARIGMVLQSWGDHRRWSVRTLLAHLTAHYSGLVQSPRGVQNVDQLLEAVGLTAQAHRRIGQLSGGQRRRLDVAIGLVGNPELIFLDEPTTGFDPEARAAFHELIRSIARQRSTAMVLTTHDLTEAELLADSVAILVSGRIVARGTTETIARKHSWGTRVSWREHERLYSKTVSESVPFVRDLSLTKPHITDLEVRPFSLHDAYLEMIGHVEDAHLHAYSAVSERTDAVC